MFLKNYTSEAPVSQTIYRIEQVLIKCGVNGIGKEYGPGGTVVAITFTIQPGENVPRLTIRLPANKETAMEALWLDYVGEDKIDEKGRFTEWGCRKKKKKTDFADQAERTAWKIVQDWVEVQMSMIQMKQAEYTEVFLPYVWDGRQTVFQRIKESGFRALLPEKCE